MEFLKRIVGPNVGSVRALESNLNEFKYLANPFDSLRARHFTTPIPYRPIS